MLLFAAGVSHAGKMPVLRLSRIHRERNQGFSVVSFYSIVTLFFSLASRFPSFLSSCPSSIYVRENSIEYNQPTIQPSKAITPLASVFCCGYSPTDLSVRDNVQVVYFDDLIMDTVRNNTRTCNPLLTFCCGGRGEELRLESTFCFDLCYRGRCSSGADGGCCPTGSCCVPCVPVGCPDCFCPCATRVSPPQTSPRFLSRRDVRNSFFLP